MAQDYFSDLQNDDDSEAPSVPVNKRATPERSIRNISVSSRRQAMSTPRPVVNDVSPEREDPVDVRQTARRSASWRPRIMVWGIALVAVLILAAGAFLIVFADTSIDVMPRIHRLTFDPSTQFTAYPESDNATGGITYRVQTADLEDSQTVAATGTEKAEDRASGSITVYNSYSTSPVRLIKNTRFESPNGLVFRIPASIEVPPKKGDTPGEISITVFADQAGDEYNLGPTDTFIVPGLKSTPLMYKGVYAKSVSAFSGGFVGTKPAIAQTDLESARAEIRGRLQKKIAETINGITDGFAFPDLVAITYESMPTTPDSAGGGRVTEKAHVTIPIFPTQNFAHAIAQAVSADAADESVTLKRGDNFKGAPASQLPENLGEGPLVFTLDGEATVVWEVDTGALQQALAGRDQGAFKTIIAGFKGVESAEAHIAPFWSSTFPQDASNIEVRMVDPLSGK